MAGYIGSGASVVSSGAENKKVFDITTNTTSLTGLNYTVGKVHVYHNGVRLVDGTDYTATNSISITLTVAAVSGDQVVVVSYASFQLSEHYTKAETDALVPSSIDDNGNATALTIDSSENVLVGKTTDAFGTAGIALRSTVADFTRDSGTPVNVNRLTDDGRLIALHKDSVVVGSIGTQGSRLSIGSGDVNLNFNASANSMYPISDPAAGTLSSGIVDLGAALATFKDAYLSGGIYLGGTGSANKLEDYEEGTWTPTNAGDPTGTISANGKYVKIGRQVTCHATMSITATFTNATIGGLPFNPHHEATLSSIHGAAIAIGSNIKMVSVNNGSGNLTTRDVNNSGDNPNGSQLIRFSITYQTNN